MREGKRGEVRGEGNEEKEIARSKGRGRRGRGGMTGMKG